VQTDSKYGRGLNLQPEQFYNPSPVMRGVARGARDAVASGNTVPTMTNPANYGKMPVVNYSAPGGAAGSGGTADPTSAPATAILAALRAKGLVADDNQQTSPWLAA
jgi:predicted deacylase